MALAGAIMPGVATFIVMPSAQADVFGVGTTVIVGSMLVPPSSVTSGRIVPRGGFAGICGVESGKAAPLVGGPPGVVLQTVVEELPSKNVGAMVPVVLPTFGTAMVPNGTPGVISAVVVDGIVVAVLPVMDVGAVFGTVDNTGTGAAVMDGGGETGIPGGGGAEADGDGIVPVVPPVTDVEASVTVGVAGAICPDGVAQVTKVPGVAGLEVSGSGASVVAGTPGMVATENGLGPLSGEDSIVPGVDERPMAVVPMVETCAGLALQPNSRAIAVSNKRRIAISSAPI